MKPTGRVTYSNGFDHGREDQVGISVTTVLS